MKRAALDKWICELEGLPELSREALSRLQLRRLNELLSRERARGGFYAGLPERVGSLAELAQLPFTTAEQLSQNSASPAAPRGRASAYSLRAATWSTPWVSSPPG